MFSLPRTLGAVIGVLGLGIAVGVAVPPAEGPEPPLPADVREPLPNTSPPVVPDPAGVRAQERAQQELLAPDPSVPARGTPGPDLTAPDTTPVPTGQPTPRPTPGVAVAKVAAWKVRTRACRTGRVALTFDDGPHPVRTRLLVNWLVQEDIPATFFVVGSRVSEAPGMIRAMSGNPRLFTVANHTWRHPDLRRLTTAAVRHSVAATRKAINRHGRASGLMRPPYGAINPRVRRALQRERLVPVLWNVDSEDWKGGNRHQIAHRILSQLQPHRANVVLQHDGVNNSHESVGAVPIVVREARRRGYCFVPLNPDGTPGKLLARR